MHDDKFTGYVPSEQWRADFQKQATKAMLDKLNRIARARLGVYAGGKQNVQECDVDDVVISALGDTWTGTLAWDPDAKPLYAHLKDAIKYRVRNEAKLARKRRKHDEFEEDERGERSTRSPRVRSRRRVAPRRPRRASSAVRGPRDRRVASVGCARRGGHVAARRAREAARRSRRRSRRDRDDHPRIQQRVASPRSPRARAARTTARRRAGRARLRR